MSRDKNEIVEHLETIVGKGWTITEHEFIEPYLKDETPDEVRPKPATEQILVKPYSTKEVSGILEIANRTGTPVFPVGGRTGLVGGSVPTKPGIILSLERMKRIEIDKENMMAVAEAGATLGDLLKAAEEADLFFPPHPGDEGAQIGGLVATNAGGSRAVKYGVMRNYVKGIEAVLPTGEVLNLGGKLLKNNTGYDLMSLIMGSEGTLCVITNAVIKLYPKSMFMATLVVPFDNRSDAIGVVPKILRSAAMPLAIEYVQLKEVEEAAEHLNEKWPARQGKDHLMIILTAASEEELLFACEQISKVCEENNALEVLLAETKNEQDRILRIRSNLYTALKPRIVDILDVTVPPNKLGNLIDKVDAIAEKHGIYLPVYGHAGDGNLHIHVMKEEGKSSDYAAKVKEEIYSAGVSLGGVITGEHGIGQIRIGALSMVLSDKEKSLMKGIKKLFDPNSILNPGKVLMSN